MPTVSKTWVFLADAEGLADAGLDANLAVSFQSGDGNPAGDLEWIQSVAVNGDEKARKPTTDSWQTLFGVPAGATVTNVQVTAWDSVTWGTSGVAANGLRTRIRFVDSGGTIVHSAGDLADVSEKPAAGGVVTGHGAGTNQPVDATYQAAATGIRLEVELNTTVSGTTNIDYEHDNIAVTVTYTAAAAGGSPPLPVGSPLTGLGVPGLPPFAPVPYRGVEQNAVGYVTPMPTTQFVNPLSLAMGPQLFPIPAPYVLPPAQVTFNDSGSGTITLGGTGVESLSHSRSGSGQITLGGSGTDSISFPGSGTGTITLGGSGVESIGFSGSGTGTITLGGSGTESITYPGSGTGTITLTGSGSENYVPPGGGGAPAPTLQQHHQQLAAGML